MSTRQGCGVLDRGQGGKRTRDDFPQRERLTSKHMKMRYVFHSSRLIRTGVIMTTKKFQVQWDETEMAVPRDRASKGRISGP